MEKHLVNTAFKQRCAFLDHHNKHFALKNLGRVHFLLRFFSPSQIHLRFKTEKPSQLLLKCEKVCILKSP